MYEELRAACEATINSGFLEPVQYEWEFFRDDHMEDIYWLRRRSTGLAPRPDDHVELRVCVQVKQRVRPSDLSVLFAATTEECDQRMLFTEYATATVRERLRDDGIWYADAQGNVHIRARGLVILFEGERPRAMTAPSGQFFSAPGAKALHYLLKAGPRVHATYRAIRKETGVSIDKIGKVVRELEHEKVLRVHGAGDYEVVNGDRLLEQWVAAYAAKLAPILLLGRYVTGAEQDANELANRASVGLGKDVLIGGEVAGGALTHYLRPGSLRLYLPLEAAPEARTLLRLAPSERGVVDLCLRYGDALVGATNVDGLRLVDPAFAYAELMSQEDGRLADTAMRIRQDYLKWTS